MPQQGSSFEEKAAALEEAMRAAGYPVVRTSGRRTADEQAKLYAQGRTEPGRRVTGKSGAPGDESPHQAGLANDFAFVGKDGKPSWDESHPWDVLGAKAKELGLEWGGDWKSADRPHVQEPKPSVSTSETFRTKVGADAATTKAPELAPAGSPRRTPIPAGKSPQRKYSYAEVAQAWKAEFPGEFDRFDNSDLIKAILEEQPEFGNIMDHSTEGTESVPPPNLGGLEQGPDLSRQAKGPVAPPPSSLRLPTYTDMAIEAGLAATPTVLGGAIGSSVGPGGTAIGAAAGGAAGEFLREGYQNWSGTRDDGFSVPNIAAQGAINAIPFAKYAGKGLSAMAPSLVEGVAPAVARVAGSTFEGAVASATSTGAEAAIRDHRVPGLGEIATSAAFGAPFGAAIGAAGEAVHAYKANKALPDPALVDMHFNDLKTSPDRNKAAQAIYDLATQVGQDNPAAGAQILQRLVGEANALQQADLRQFAGAFVQDFGKRADTLTMDGQISEVRSFLDGLKQRGAAEETISQVQGILQDIRTTSSPRPIDQPSEVGWYTPVDRDVNMGPNFEPKIERVGDALENTLQAPPSMDAWRMQPHDPATPGYSVGRNPPRLEEQQDLGLPASTTGMRDGQKLAEIPGFGPQGVDTLPAVQNGKLGRDEALMVQWMLDDLHNFQYHAPEPASRGVQDDRALDTFEAEASEVAGRNPVLWTQHEAGTPILKMFDQLGIGLTRTGIATQLENLLKGTARRPGKAALAARKISKAMLEAWVPAERKFDWSLVQDSTLKEIGFTSRRQFQAPYGNLHERLGGIEQPKDILEKFGVALPREGPPGPLTHHDWAPDQVSEARKLVQGASNEQLLALHEDLKYGSGMEHLENPEDFSGAWYDVGPGLVGAELERRGLGTYKQPDLLTEGPGTPGQLSIKGESAPALDERVPVTRVTRPGDPLASAGDRTWFVRGHLGDEAAAKINDMYASGTGTVHRGYLPAEDVGTPAPSYDEFGHEMFHVPTESAARFEPHTGPLGPEQRVLMDSVRAEEREQPLLMDERELFSLTPETVKISPAGRKAQAPGLFDETGAVGDVTGRRNIKNSALRDVAISHEDFQDLKDTVESAGGEEVAGLLLGDAEGNIRRVVLSDNRAANPEKFFEIGADVIARAQHFARSQGWDVLGSFHSQPTGSAEPSKRDLAGNVADMPMMILGVQGKSLRDVRIWQPAGSKSGATPWLEGTVHLGNEMPKPGTPVSAPTASWMVDRIPKFHGAPGDSPAMADFLKAHKGEFSTEPWYVRAQHFMEEGNARMAWVEVQAATVATQKGVRETVKASPLKDAHRDALVARVEQATAAGPQDPVGALFALYDGRTTWVDGVGRIVVAPEVPPALKGKGVSAGPGGILQPGAADIPLPSEHEVVTMTVDALNDVLKDVKGHEILDDPTQSSFTRLNRQIAEQLMLRSPSSWGATKAMRTAMKQRGMSDRQINQQIAAHLTATASQSGKFLAALSVWKQRNKAEIRSIEGIKGASGEIEDVMIIGAGGRKIGRLGDLAPVDTFKDIVAPTRAWDRAMLLNTLTRGERGTFDLFEASSRAFMLSQWATAARNFLTVNGRWGVEMFDEVASAVASTTVMKPGRALNHLKKAGDMLRYTPFLRPDGWVMPWHAMQSMHEQVFNSTAFLASLPAGAERRAAMKLLEGIPEEQGHFLGATNYGEPTPHSVSKYRILNAIASPRVQNTLTMFNRAQEFTARSAMYVVNMRDALRQRGLDPHLLKDLPPADLIAKLGGPEEVQKILQHSIGGALDYTFSGDTVKRGFGVDAQGRPKGAWYDFLIEGINKHPTIRAGYPWPKFNLSAAPRFIWDHSGVNAVVESLNDVALQLSGGDVGLKRGRFYLGRQAAAYEGTHIPEAKEKYSDAQAELGDSLQKVQALSREFSIRKRMVARLDRRGLTAAANSERVGLDTLETALQREMAGFERTEDRMKGLQAQIGTLQKDVDQAKAIRAPETYAELWGRAGAGMATMMMPAILLRADQHDKGTKWYQLRYDIPGLGDTVIDTRPFAPFTQFLFFADVINDLHHNTDWAGVSEDLDKGSGFLEAMYGRYEGKYTNKSLGAETMNALVSMSQAAGTTLAVLELGTKIADRGFPSPKEVGDTVISAFGSLLARFTIPFAQFKGASDSVFENESNARITSTDQGWAAPLAQPIANLPFLGAAVIPETYNQLTGKPLDSFRPDLRASLGLTLKQFDRMSGEINDTGVPGSAVYIRSTHDVFLDRLIGFNYAQAVARYSESMIFSSEQYQKLSSPAAKRDYLQAHVFPVLKKIALGWTMLDVGHARMEEAREGPEQRRRRLRSERLQGLAKQEGVSFEEEPDDLPEHDELADPASPEMSDDPQPSQTVPPSGANQQGSLHAAPAFEERPQGALDRVLGPAFDA